MRHGVVPVWRRVPPRCTLDSGLELLVGRVRVHAADAATDRASLEAPPMPAMSGRKGYTPAA
jgi:hypothetical protein